MPRLEACGRSFVSSADDFACPALTGLALRAIWALAFVVAGSTLYEYDEQSHECLLSIRIYLWVGFVSHLIGFGASLWLLIASSQGTIIDISSRKAVPVLVIGNLSLSVVDLAVAMVGLWLVVADPVPECAEVIADHSHVGVRAFQAATFANCALGAIGVGFIVLFVWGSHPIDLYSPGEEDAGHDAWARRWERRCRQCGCCCWGVQDRDAAFRRVGRVMAASLHAINTGGLTISDLAAGMSLLRLQHAEEEAEWRREQQEADFVSQAMAEAAGGRAAAPGDVVVPPKRFSNQTFDGSRPMDLGEPWQRQVLWEASRFAPYALAAYGWPMYALMHPVTSSCRLTAGACMYGLGDCACCDERHTGPLSFDESQPARCGGRPARLHRGDCCCLGLAAARMQTDLPASAYLVASFENDAHHRPFIVFADDEVSALVVSVRGTLSITDCLVDADLDPIDAAAALQAQADAAAGAEHTAVAVDGPVPVHSPAPTAAAAAAVAVADDKDVVAQHSHGGAATPVLPPPLPSDQQHQQQRQQQPAVAAAQQPPGTAAQEAAATGRLGGEGSAAGLGGEDPGALLAHRAMWVAATAIKRRLKQSGVLALLQPRHGRPARLQQLVIIGHSLGAGVASLLAIQMRSDFPSLRCYAFSPPGLMVSPRLGTWLERRTSAVLPRAAEAAGDQAASGQLLPTVTSVMVGKDMVPRTTLRSLRLFQEQLATAMLQANLSKAALFTGACGRSCARLACLCTAGRRDCVQRSCGDLTSPQVFRTEAQVRDLVRRAYAVCGEPVPNGLAPATLLDEGAGADTGLLAGETEGVLMQRETAAFVVRLHRVVEASRRGPDSPRAGSRPGAPSEGHAEAVRRLQATEMRVPGRMLHAVKLETRWVRGCGRCAAERVYDAVWAPPRAVDRLLVSTLMVRDHLPDKVVRVFTSIAKRRLAPDQA